MSKVVYHVHIEPIPKGGFAITVPALPACRGFAKTFNKALSRAKTAIEKHLTALNRAGQRIPIETQAVLCLPTRVNLPRKARVVLAFAPDRAA